MDFYCPDCKSLHGFDEVIFRHRKCYDLEQGKIDAELKRLREVTTFPSLLADNMALTEKKERLEIENKRLREHGEEKDKSIHHLFNEMLKFRKAIDWALTAYVPSSFTIELRRRAFGEGE